jgi:hypothetical protein
VSKILGRRRTDRHDPAALQRTLASVRGTGALVPRGVDEVGEGDVARYAVVRVADEIVV